MRHTSAQYASLFAIALLVGCQAPGLEPLVAPDGAGRPAAAQAASSEVAVSIRWPYRAQVLPTSAQHLSLQLSGPTTDTVELFRPEGSAPTSTATLSVEVGTGYTLTVQAYDNAPTPRLVASGTSATFNVRANERTNVTVALQAAFVPRVRDFFPTNGGPGATVTVYGTAFGADRGLTPGFTFNGVPATVVYPPQEGTVSVLVPLSATTGPIVPRLDGVTGTTGTGSFTVLGALEIWPPAATLASGDVMVFAARATTSANAPFAGTPAVNWSVSGQVTSLPISNYRIQGGGDGIPDPSTASTTIGTVDPAGRFTATGTGSVYLTIMSGTLLATAAITVQ